MILPLSASEHTCYVFISKDKDKQKQVCGGKRLSHNHTRSLCSPHTKVRRERKREGRKRKSIEDKCNKRAWGEEERGGEEGGERER